MILEYLDLVVRIQQELDDLVRFRHVVRNIYAFQFDPERVLRLVNQMRPTWIRTQIDLSAFVEFLERVAGQNSDE